MFLHKQKEEWEADGQWKGVKNCLMGGQSEKKKQEGKLQQYFFLCIMF